VAFYEGASLRMIQIVKVFRSNQSDKTSVLQESDAVPKNERLAHIVRYEDHRFAESLLKPAKLFLDFGSCYWIQGAERFVQEKKRWICRERSRQIHRFFSWTNRDRKSTRLNSSHVSISYAVFCLKKKKTKYKTNYLDHIDISV